MISVVMGVYKQKNIDELDMAIHSIINQRLTDWEFLICDDGSPKEIGEHLDQYMGRDKRIVVFHNEQNEGLASSLNRCIAMAKGNYIARMDADDYSNVDRLLVQYEFLEKHPELDWCGCNAALFDGKGNFTSRFMPSLPQKEDFLRFSPYIHPTVMFRKSVFALSDGYNTAEELLRCEDYELFMRLHKQGFRGCNIQQELYYYRENKASYKRRTWKTRINEMRLRRNWFTQLGIPSKKSRVYVLRPVLGALTPNWIIGAVKRRESEKYHEQFFDDAGQTSVLQQAAAKETGAASGSKTLRRHK